IKRLHPELVAALTEAADYTSPPGAETFESSTYHFTQSSEEEPRDDFPQVKGVCALTFDDGPHPVGTEMLLEVLEAAQIKATFFLLGKEVSRNKILCRRLVEMGHELGAHGWIHVS